MKEIMEIFFNLNSAAAFLGWVAFNFTLLSIHKDEDEKAFNLKSYASDHWDNWLGSAIFIPILLWVGYKKLNLGVLNIESPDWNDLYYLASGFAFELLKKLIQKVRGK